MLGVSLIFSVGSFSTMNKHKHFTHLWKHLICTNFLAVETRGDTCRWRKDYQWSRTSYGGNFIHLGIHVLACSKYNHPSNFIYLLITVNNITTIGTHPQCVIELNILWKVQKWMKSELRWIQQQHHKWFLFIHLSPLTYTKWRWECSL